MITLTARSTADDVEVLTPEERRLLDNYRSRIAVETNRAVLGHELLPTRWLVSGACKDAAFEMLWERLGELSK